MNHVQDRTTIELPPTMTISAHPYFPEGITLSGNTFTPNDWDVFSLISAFAVGWAVILGAASVIVKKINPALKKLDQALVWWFILSGSIHVFFEGYFMLNHTRMASMQDFFGQLWKEYALSDSRYMRSDPFVLVMESYTAIGWGPLCLLTAALITIESPYRHALQALVSMGQFYGNLLYYTTSLFEDIASGKRNYRPEPYYFWFYFIFMNAIWLVIPLLCMYSSVKASAKAFKAAGRLQNGAAKKSN